jgi:hypothetical protein
LAFIDKLVRRNGSTNESSKSSSRASSPHLRADEDLEIKDKSSTTIGSPRAASPREAGTAETEDLAQSPGLPRGGALRRKDLKYFFGDDRRARKSNDPSAMQAANESRFVNFAKLDRLAGLCKDLQRCQVLRVCHFFM